LCPRNFTAFYDEMTGGSLDQRKAVYVVHLSFGKVFSTVSCVILVSKLGLTEQGRGEESWIRLKGQ